jgi:hypothetical protein
VRLAPEAWVVRFHEDWTTIEKLVATFERLELQSFHGFVGIKCEVGRQEDVGQSE